MSGSPRSVVALNLGPSTAYAVRGDRTVLVDAGPAGSGRRLLRRLARGGVDPESISLIVLTHTHPDHAGGAEPLSQALGVPVAVHRREADAARAGHSPLYAPRRPLGHLLARVMPETFPAVATPLIVEDGADLSGYGAPLTVLHTPGHTPGSITLLHGRLGAVGTALVGDLLAGGLLRRNRPGMPFLADDPDDVRRSVARLIATRPGHLVFGHGRPATAASVLRRGLASLDLTKERP